MKRYCLKIIVCIIVIGLCCVLFIWSDWFFGAKTTIAEKLKYVGAFIGGILVALNAYFIYMRTKEQNRNNNLIAKGQLDTRFKDAATLLAAGNTSAQLSGIHALNQIAIEASKTEDQKDYVKVIKDILITFIKDNSVIEYESDERGNQIVKTAKNKIESDVVLQTIIDILFKDEKCEIYTQYPTDLSGIVLVETGVNFHDAQLQNAKFWAAQLQNVSFGKAQLQNADFSFAQLENAEFWYAQLENAKFWYAQLENAKFNNTLLRNAKFDHAQLQNAKFFQAQLQNANLNNTQLENTVFEYTQSQNAKFCYAQLENAKFYYAQLENATFGGSNNIEKAIFEGISWNKKMNFNGTIFKNKTIEELTKIMGKPPLR